MIKFNIGDILNRNSKHLEEYNITDPKKIKIIGFSSINNLSDNDINMENFRLNLCEGYIIQDIFSDEKECASYEYVEYYYFLDQRKEKLKRINNF
jgi:hypothetical protein